MMSRGRKRINRSVGPDWRATCYATGQLSKKGMMMREAKDEFFPGSAAVDWWQTTLEFVQLNWDWIGVALVMIACAIAGWAIYRALNRGARGWRDEI